LSRWATTGVLPLETVVCLSGDEVRAVLGTGRLASLVLVDAGTSALDRDLVASALRVGVPVVVVDDGRTRRDWDSLGCSETVAADLTPDQLMDLLGRYARPVDPSQRITARSTDLGDRAPQRCRVVSVTGTGGSGSSTVASALAQGLSSASSLNNSVALIDGSRRSGLTVLHDPGDVLPGLPELVEAFRSDEPDPSVIRSMLRPIPTRGYDLLLGLRRTRDWAGLRPLALTAALNGLARSYDTVVIDHDADVEGEPTTGSIDVEERHGLCRWSARTADLLVLVGRNDLAGLHALASIRADLLDAEVPSERILTVLNCCTGNRLPRPTQGLVVGGSHPPVRLPKIRGMEMAHRAVAKVPSSLVRPITRAVVQTLEQLGDRPATPSAVPIRPGELGSRLDGEVA